MSAALALHCESLSASHHVPDANIDLPDGGSRLLELLRRLESCPSRDEALEIIASRVLQPESLHSCALVAIDEDDGEKFSWESLSGSLETVEVHVRQTMTDVALRACREQRPIVMTSKDPQQHTCMAVPVKTSTADCAAFVGVPQRASSWRDGLARVHESAIAFSYWSALNFARGPSPEGSDSSPDMSDWADVLVQSSVRDAAQLLAEQMASAIRARAVVLGRWNATRESSEVLAISTTPDWDPRSERLRQYRAAFDECKIEHASTIWSRSHPEDDRSSVVLKRLADSYGCACVACTPLSPQGSDSPYMVLVLADEQNKRQLNTSVAIVADLAEPILKLHQRAERVGLRHMRDTCCNWLAHRKCRLILGLCIILLAGLFIPVTHSIHCNCVTQPVVRRFVVAPFEGTLKTVLVRLGEQVEPGQVLAYMDERDVELELASVAAELDRSRSQRDGHLAVKDFVAAELARFEVERLRIRQQQLLDRKDKLAITTPIAGLVIAGDLTDSEGAPVRLGQGLFEIAPVDELIVEAEIPEDQVQFVRAGLPLEITTDAFPYRSWKRQLKQIHPQSEKREDHFAFIGETVIENHDQALRPGMHGRVEITAGQRALGWCLFHRAWEKVRIWTGW